MVYILKIPRICHIQIFEQVVLQVVFYLKALVTKPLKTYKGIFY
jgi:hypothetical protein